VSAQFHSLYRHDFVRLAACVPRTEVGDPDFNFVETMRLAARGDAAKAALMVFPELGLSSYAIEDLLFQDALLRAVERRIG
jgi:NAD+ synthase (glutamine-hydrolysing)